MNAKANTRRPGAVKRHLILSPALVVVLALSFTGAASAQTTFQATIAGQNPKSKPCVSTVTPPPPAVFCGSASIAGYGPATWTFNVNGTTPASGPCPFGPPAFVQDFTYSATTTFELQDAQHSTLTLSESGLVCAPGNSASSPQSFGLPQYALQSNSAVESATGQFSGLPVGAAGTDSLHAAGAQISGTYSGT